MDNEKMQKLDSIWTDLGEEFVKERRSLENDRRKILAKSEKLEAEKEAMAKSGATDGDVLELNVGGETFMVQRGTLLPAPEDSHLHAMFSGRWEESLSRTKEGAIFVEMSPHVFRVILSRLRSSKLQAKPPTWGALKASDPIYETELQAVLKFFGLVNPIPPIVLKACAGGGIDIVDGLVLTRNGDGGNSCRASIGSEEVNVGSVWKIHIKTLLNNHWVFAGIIGASATPSVGSYSESTSFGWASGSRVYVKGVNSSNKDGWAGWQENDMTIFKLESTSLKMYHTRLDRTFTLPLTSENGWKMHFNMFSSGDEVEVSMPTDEETRILD